MTAPTGCTPEANQPGGSRIRPNIILVLLDTLRADHVGFGGYSRPTTPHLDGLAAQGISFPNAFAAASYTRASTASLMTGVYPSVHGAVAYGDSIARGLPTLAQLLRQRGYETVGYYLNGNISAQFGFHRGFHRYISPNKAYRKAHPASGWSTVRWQADDRSIPWITRTYLDEPKTRPFFLYLHFVAPHAPYAPPRKLNPFVTGPLTPTAELFYRPPQNRPNGKPLSAIERMQLGALAVNPRSRRQIIDLYDGEIAFVDGLVGEILALLEDRALLKKSIVVLTSDHGEEFWDHGGMGHGTSHYRELLQVPLLIVGPGIPRGVRVEPVGLMDLMPTLLELAGAVIPRNLSGRSLVELIQGQPSERVRELYAEGLVRYDETGAPIDFFRSLQQGRYKLVLDGRLRKKNLYDEKLNPAETRNLLPGHEKQAVDLLARLREIHRSNLATLSTGGYRQETADISPELESQLAALGYVGGGEPPENPVFLRPMGGQPDAHPLGFLGDEAQMERYSSAIQFAVETSFSGEQLLYGWRRFSDNLALMKRGAGVRLKRAEQKEWWLRGFFPKGLDLENPIRIAIRVDGKPAGEFRVRDHARFTISGSLPTARRPFTRLDATCQGSPWMAPFGDLDQNAPCVLVFGLGLR